MKYKHVVYSGSKYIPFDDLKVVESEVLSSLFMQKLIYFHTFYDFAYVYMMIFSFGYK